MAIARDATSSGTEAGTVATIAHTCTGDDRLLLVYVADASGTDDDVSGATYDGVGMTELAKLNGTGGRNWSVYMFGILAPATGANNIVVTRGSSTSSMIILNSSYTGVLQSGLPDATDTQQEEDSTSVTTTLTTVADNAWAFMVASTDGEKSAGTNSTEVLDFSGSMAVDNQGFGDISPPGSFSLTVDITTQRDCLAVMASFAPAVVAPTFIPSITIF